MRVGRVGWAGAACLAAAMLAGCAFVPRPRPNVLFIVIDALRSDHLGFAGYPRPTSPCLDILAAEGFAFTAVLDRSSDAPAQWTSGDGSPLGGLDPAHDHGGYPADALTFSARVDPRCLAAILGPRGWATGAFPGRARMDHCADLTDRFDHVYRRRHHPEDLVPAQDLTGAALVWIKSVGDAPWFCLIHYADLCCPAAVYPAGDQGDDAGEGGRSAENPAGEGDTPHTAAVPPSGYDGRIAALDDQICRLLDTLTALRVIKGLLVVVAADHRAGPAEGTVDDPEHGEDHGSPGGPLVVWWPGRIPRGRLVHIPIESASVVPTILDLVGFPAHGAVQGASLARVLR